MSVHDIVMAAAGASGPPIQYVGGTSLAVESLSTGGTISLTGLTGGIASSPSAGDLVVVCSSVGAQFGSSYTYTISGNNSGTYSSPSGLSASNNSTYDVLVQIHAKFLSAGSIDTSISISGTGVVYSSTVFVQVWRNVNATSISAVNKSTQNAGGQARPDPAAITPTTTKSMIVVIGGCSPSYANVFTASGITNFSSIKTTAAFNGYNAMGGCGYVPNPTTTVNLSSWSIAGVTVTTGASSASVCWELKPL